MAHLRREPSEAAWRFRLELPALSALHAKLWPTRHNGARGVSPTTPHTSPAHPHIQPMPPPHQNARRAEEQDYVARNLSLRNNAYISAIEDLTSRSLPREKILTRGKWGTTCCRARGRPSNASSDPVQEMHAPTAALEGRKQVACQLAKR